MDFQIAFNIALAVAGTVIGWVVRIVYDTQERLRADMLNLEQKLPETYVRRDDFTEFARDMKEGIQRILDKLDSKQDK